MVLRLKRGGACDLAGIAHGVFMSGGIPIEGMPFAGICVMAAPLEEGGDVLGVERMADAAAILAPQVVIVNFDQRSGCIYTESAGSPVHRWRRGRAGPWGTMLPRKKRAGATAQSCGLIMKAGCELGEEGLLQFIAEAIAIRIDRYGVRGFPGDCQGLIHTASAKEEQRKKRGRKARNRAHFEILLSRPRRGGRADQTAVAEDGWVSGGMTCAS